MYPTCIERDNRKEVRLSKRKRNEMERLLCVNEAAILLGLSKWTIRKWLSQDKIKPVRLGRRVLFESTELNRLIQEGKRQSQTADC